MTFAELEIHPALASALSTRGYDTPTSVQAAVLGPDCSGRDLLVSSQTGSGKTIAFGAALAGTLLGPTDTKIPHGPKPIALVIVPTRELAAQVREELRWLLHATHVRLASFTGGTPVSGDLKALQRGVELVIGTPGRLVDLIRRTRLDLSDLKVVVLDEADEMLDLGFREDLETLLQAAPATRRTLLLSATLPPEIRALARRYQRDALAIDPRKDAGGAHVPGKGAHDDITHRAHLVAGGDRLAAVVNVLRAEKGARAIVFCTTREGVAAMHAALTARGFGATAISGDRAQAERDRALDQLRRGEVQVLVATNVAARGLHLPDVDLIVHADLPLNADSLIHRSGRTGRAGRKGTAVVIATVAERRKAERLLGAAQVQAAWTAPPSAETITAAARARFADELLASPTPDAEDGTTELLEQLEGKLSAHELAHRLLAREVGRLPTGESIRVVPISSGRSDGYQGEGPAEARRPRREFSREGVLFRVNLGGKDNADPRWMLPLICRRGEVTRNEVGAIRIGPRETTFEIAGDAAQAFAQAASVSDPRAPHVTIQRADARAPRDAGPRPPHDAGPRPPRDAGPRPPRDAGPRPPRDAGPRPPRDAGPRPPHDAGPRPPRDAGPRPPRDAGPRAPDAPPDANRPTPPIATRATQPSVPRPAPPDAPVDARRPAHPKPPRPVHASAPANRPAHPNAPRPAHTIASRPARPIARRDAPRPGDSSPLRSAHSSGPRPAYSDTPRSVHPNAPRDGSRPAYSNAPRPTHSNAPRDANRPTYPNASHKGKARKPPRAR